MNAAVARVKSSGITPVIIVQLPHFRKSPTDVKFISRQFSRTVRVGSGGAANVDANGRKVKKANISKYLDILDFFI